MPSRKTPAAPKLTRFELETLINHTLRDLSYGVGGTFVADDSESVNKKEADAARRAVEKLRAMLPAAR